MKIRVQFFAQLRDETGTSELDIELPEGETVDGLLKKLYRQMPGLRDWDKTILVGAGVEFVDRAYVVRPNDQIAIMPPVQGG